jgi:LPXTG-motif cell wall-anchored protein
MSIRHAFGTIAAGVLMSVAVFAQTSGQTPTQQTPPQPTSPQPTAQAGTQPETPITLVGCIQREADYRRERDKGRGGAVGTGTGTGHEFVLINASTSTATAGTPAPSGAEPCAPGGKGEAYELTGNRERDLEQFVGRRIEITGMLKKHETAGTSGTGAPKPTGGFDPMGQDLQLPEVNVTSFKEVAVSRPPAPPGEAAAQPDTPAAPEPQPVATTGLPDELPRTGSSLPMAGLIGLLSLGAALGLRSFRRP